MGRTGVELLGDDPNLDTNSLLYRMAIEEQFLEPLRAFKRRRLLANLNLDLMVPLGTAAFMTPAEVDWHRQAYSNSYGIVRTIYPTDAIGISNIPGHGGTCVSDSQCDVFGEDYKSKSWQPVDEMIKSLDSLGWEKVIVNFKGILPLAHNQIAALTKFTTIIDGLLGFHEGRYLMRESTEWLTSE